MTEERASALHAAPETSRKRYVNKIAVGADATTAMMALALGRAPSNHLEMSNV
jgi:hypothetical protein